jgi:tetratricopeptide (TPR) repeat protein
MNLYQLLEVEISASRDEIKRAYFRLVRKYTPENNPEMFMKIRHAYEELTDEVRRKSYDSKLSDVDDVPEDAASDILKAKTLAEKGLISDAVNLLQKGKYSTQEGKLAAQLTLCDIYTQTGKAAQATKLASKLIEEYPDDPRTYEAAISACIERGWTNKAGEYARGLLEFDPGNEKGHITVFKESGESYSPFSLGAIVETVESHGKHAPIVCSLIMQLCLNENYAEEEDFFEYEQSTLPGFESEIMKKTAPWDDINYVFDRYHRHTVGLGWEKRDFVYIFIVNSALPDIYRNDKFELLPNVDCIIKNIEREDIFELPIYILTSIGHSALLARKSGIPKIIVALAIANAFINSETCPEQDVEDYRNEIIINEFEIILQLPQIKTHIKKFKKNFIDLYIPSADFFDKVQLLNESKMYAELDRRVYKYDRIDTRLTFDWLGVDEYCAKRPYGSDEVQNVPIHSEKIGRNSQCPCNSGKKYKKCCGTKINTQ